MCKAFAPMRVAISKVSLAGRVVGSPLKPFCKKEARRISSNMSRSLFEAGPSVPMPTFNPNSSILFTGATPEASFRLEEGL